MNDVATNLAIALDSSAQALHLMSLPTLLILPERLGDGVRTQSYIHKKRAKMCCSAALEDAKCRHNYLMPRLASETLMLYFKPGTPHECMLT